MERKRVAGDPGNVFALHDFVMSINQEHASDSTLFELIAIWKLETGNWRHIRTGMN